VAVLVQSAELPITKKGDSAFFMQICIDCQEVDEIRVGISVTPQNLEEREKKEIYLGFGSLANNFL